MSVFAGAGGKAGGNKKVPHHPELGPKFAAVKTVLEHVGLYIGLACYTALGAKVFQMLENPHEIKKSSHYKGVLNTSRNSFLEKISTVSRNDADCNSSVEKLLSEYEAALSEVMTAGINIVTQNYTQNWDYLQSVFFSTTILTTIGYGNIAPVTAEGRIFCILFAIIGVPFTLSVIADVGQLNATCISNMYRKYNSAVRPYLAKYNLVSQNIESLGGSEEEEEEEDSVFQNNFVTVVLSLLFFVLFLSLGAGMFTLWEDWTFLDGFYFCFITMTTIGFGDIVPDIVGEKTSYMLVCTIYILVGMAITTTIIELVRRKYAESWRKMQELRAQIQAQLKLADTLKKLGEQAERNNLAIDLDIGSDLAELKANLAKFKKGKHGKGLEDIDIEQLDWVENNKKVKAVTILIYETSL